MAEKSAAKYITTACMKVVSDALPTTVSLEVVVLVAVVVAIVSAAVVSPLVEIVVETVEVTVVAAGDTADVEVEP